jgi:hypothetical protein
MRGDTDTPTRARPYADPYVAGIGVGLALLAAFVLVGRGLGASGAVASAVTAGIDAVAPAHAAGSAFWSRYLGDGGASPLRDWLVVELVGVAIGAFLSAAAAGRLRAEVERGPRIARAPRLLLAAAGGAVMGGAAMLARGCTSGLALTGGAALAVGAWIFVAATFAAAFLAAPLLRRQWR